MATEKRQEKDSKAANADITGGLQAFAKQLADLPAAQEKGVVLLEQVIHNHTFTLTALLTDLRTCVEQQRSEFKEFLQMYEQDQKVVNDARQVLSEMVKKGAPEDKRLSAAPTVRPNKSSLFFGKPKNFTGEDPALLREFMHSIEVLCDGDRAFFDLESLQGNRNRVNVLRAYTSGDANDWSLLT